MANWKVMPKNPPTPALLGLGFPPLLYTIQPMTRVGLNVPDSRTELQQRLSYWSMRWGAWWGLMKGFSTPADALEVTLFGLNQLVWKHVAQHHVTVSDPDVSSWLCPAWLSVSIFQLKNISLLLEIPDLATDKSFQQDDEPKITTFLRFGSFCCPSVSPLFNGW